MTNKILNLFCVTLLLAGMGACKKNNLVVDKDPLEVPVTVKFATNNLTGPMTYFVTSDAGTEYKIPVGLTHANTEDTKVQFSYSSTTAVAGTQYSAPAELTIKAGSVIDTLRIKGIFAGLANGRKDVLNIKITGASVPKTGFNDSASIRMQQLCPITDALIKSFAGVYAHTDEYSSSGAHSYGPYETAVKGVTITSATTAEMMVENIYDYGLGDTKIVLDWSDQLNPKVTVPTQNVGSGYIFKTAASKNGTFSSCDGTIDIIIDISGAETVSGYRVHLAR